MKKIITLLLFVPLTTMAQDWHLGGNFVPLSQQPILGTNNNFPLRIRTNQIERIHINGTGTTPNPSPGFPGPITTTGFVGFNNALPMAPIHIKGLNGGGAIGGYRSWMNTGMLISNSTDNMYFGLMPTGVNEGNDAIINWGDNIDDGFGPDNMRFIFTSYANSGVPSSAQNGLEIMRLIYNGNVGIGPVFSNTGLPASLLHLNRELSRATFIQLTNQNGTGQTANDGLRFGIEAGNNASGYLRWQENTPFIVQTDWNNTPGGINAGERMRITSIGAPGVPNPAGASNNNITRVAISESGNNPITKPRSLLHLGYNTGLNSLVF